MNRELVNRFVMSLGKLDDEDVTDLVRALRDPKLANLMADSAKAILELRRWENANRSRNERSIESASNFPNLEERFVAALNDKEMFRSSKDLVLALNNYFELEIPDPSKSKESRARIVERTLKTLNTLKSRERESLVKNFLNLVGDSGPDYDNLFKILATRE